jgi:hypothetical protein
MSFHGRISVQSFRSFLSPSMSEVSMLPSALSSKNLHRTFLLALLVPFAVSQPIAHAQNAAQTPAPDKPRVIGNYNALPLSFERNEGQTGSDVRYLSRGAGYLLSLTDNDAVITLRKKAPKQAAQSEFGPHRSDEAHRSALSSESIDMHLVKSSASAGVAGDDPLPGTVNYFLGSDPSRWRSGVATFKRVKYTGVYPGVDLVYYGNQRQLEFDFEVAPGADPSQIELSFTGAKKLKLDHDGNLIISTPSGAVSFHKPVIYQTVAGTRRPVKGAFRLDSTKNVSFSLGTYDHSKPLIIDPILGYSTYLGDSDQAQAVALDSAGNAYVTGWTNVDFPTTPGAFQNGNFPKLNSMDDSAFVTKFNSTGTALLYSTYIGGSNLDQGLSIAVDTDDNAYIGGFTYSPDFPVTSGAYQPANHSASICNGFVTKLNNTGTQLLYSTYLGGSKTDVAQAIAVDASGNAYVSGKSESSDFPVTTGAFQSTNKTLSTGDGTVFLTKLNSTGSALVYSTFLGGSCADQIGGISVDASSFVYLAGATCSMDFPTTTGALQTTFTGTNPFDTFVTKMNTTGTALVYSTYMHGVASAIAVDSSGNAYITGSDNEGFPTTPGAFQSAPHGPEGGVNAVAAKLNSSGSALVYATYLGGSYTIWLGGWPNDHGTGIAIDSSGNAVVAGAADSVDFPITAGAFQTQNYTMLDSGDYGSFVAKLNSTGTDLLYSTYLGGSGNGDFNDDCSDCVNGLALDHAGNAYVVGIDESTDFPLSINAFQSSMSYAFVTKFNASGMVSLPATTTTLTANANPQTTAAPAIITAQVQATSGSPTPTGAIAFSANEAPWTVLTLDNTGSASYSNSTLPSGANAIAVRYYGDDNNAPSTATMTENIDITSGNLASVTTMTANANPVPYYTPVIFGIAVKDPSGKGVPEGTVQLSIDSTPLCRPATLDTTGKASITCDQLPAGADEVGVLFTSSNNSYNFSYASITENVTPLGVAPAPSFSVPSGTYTSNQTVTLSDSSPAADLLVADATVGGSFGLYQAPLTVNASVTIEAYAVIAGYTPSPTVSATYIIAPNGVLPTPTFSLAGGAYTFTQQVGILDSVQGSIIYYTTDGTTPTISSSVYETPLFVNSTETINAIAIDNGYAPSAVATAKYTINILPPDFSMSLSPATFTLGVGDTATSTITVTGANGFNGSVSLSCSGLPVGGSCTFYPTFISINTNTSGTSTLTLGYSGSTGSTQRQAPFPLAPFASLALALCWIGLGQRRHRWFSLVSFAGTLCLFSLMSCGGNSSPPPPPPPTPVTSTVTVTASSGTLSHSTTLTLTTN